MSHLLILDDDPLFCNALRERLLRHTSEIKLDIEATTSTEEAKRLAKSRIDIKEPFDIFLIDQRLEDNVDGIELWVELHRLSPGSDAIIFTGFDDPESWKRAYEAGAFRYLPKPFDTRELIYLLQSLDAWRKVNRERNILQILNSISRHIASSAVQDDLDELLREVREQIGKVINVENFIIALVDQNTHQIDFKLHYENNERQERHFNPLLEGMTGYVIEAGELLYLPVGDEEFRSSHRIAAYGISAKCWVGVPLRFENQVIGALILQDYNKPYSFSPQDVQLLVAVGDQIASHIQASLLKEQERENVERLSVLPRASTELVRLANQDENLMWRLLLTLATANYGFRFNRAWLFLTNPLRTQLEGKCAIGYVDHEAARKAWEVDMNRKMGFDDILKQLRAGTFSMTPLEASVTFSLESSECTAIREVFATGYRRILSAEKAKKDLPPYFVEAYKVEQCALLPLRASDKIIGVVILDNKHDKKPVLDSLLDQMETFLNLAGVVWDNLQSRQQREALLEATYAIMSSSSINPLKETLSLLCDAARKVTYADWALIYPLRASAGESYEYDIASVGVSQEVTYQSKIKNKPRATGVSAHILRTGKMVIQDVSKDNTWFGGEKLSNHLFVESAKIKAIMGIPIRNADTSEPLGVLYLDYLKPQVFGLDVIRQAESFANLAAIAIQNAQRALKVEQDLAQAHQLGQASQRELTILQRVMSEALANISEETVIKSALNSIPEILNQPSLITGIVLREWNVLSSQESPTEIIQTYSLNTDGNLQRSLVPPEINAKLIQEVLHQRTKKVNKKTCYIPISPGPKAMALLYAHTKTQALTGDQQSALERLAAVVALALDNIRRQNNIRNVLDAAKAVTRPFELEITLDEISNAARRIAPGISALTIWYKDPKTDRIIPGPMFGVRNRNKVQLKVPEAGGIVYTVMNSPEPIWAEVTQDNKKLTKRFVLEENIASTAAFPLRVNAEIVGAMFFNYREPHYFTKEEKILFALLAEIAASSIHKALLLEAKQRESKRREAIIEVAEAIGATLEIEPIIEKALAKLVESLETIQVSPCFLTFDDENQLLRFSPASRRFYKIDNPNYVNLEKIPLTMQAIATKLATKTKKSGEHDMIIVPDVSNAKSAADYLNLINNTRSEMCVSLVSNHLLIGILVLDSPIPDAFSKDEARLISGIAQQLTLAIERAHQSAELRFKSTVAASTAWAADIAHDINRELGIIRNKAYWLHEEADQPGRVHEYAQTIDESAARLAQAGPWGNAGAEIVVLDRELPHWIERIIRPMKCGTQIKYDLNCGDLAIPINPIAILYTLRHLTRNAIQAMNNQGELHIHSFHQEEGMVEIQIEDTGPGIDETIRSRLFQEPITSKAGQGGFGLLLARQHIMTMGGRIHLLDYQPGKGTTVCIKLPITNDSHKGAN